MPELPEVERGRRIAQSVVLNRVLVKVRVADDPIVVQGIKPRTLAAKLKGRTVRAAHRRGKYLWFEMDGGPSPIFHFGLTGQFIAHDDAKPPRYWKINLTTDDGRQLAMTNRRRLGRIRLADEPLEDASIGKLGFDPLLDMPPAGVLHGLIVKRDVPLKALLLDQSFAAGVGNWIADEVLYQAKLSPHRRSREMTPTQTRRLRTCLNRIVTRAVEVDADKDRFPRTWLFHYRWGKQADATTARGQEIVHETVGGRTTAWVPQVQQ